MDTVRTSELPTLPLHIVRKIAEFTPGWINIRLVGKEFRYIEVHNPRPVDLNELEDVECILRHPHVSLAKDVFHDSDPSYRTITLRKYSVIQYLRRYMTKRTTCDIFGDEVVDDKYRWIDDATLWYARDDALPELQWAIKIGCKLHPDTTLAAAELGRLDLLKWAVKNGCRWHPETSMVAAECGKLEVLQWAVANGCKCHPDTTIAAATSAQMDVLDFAVEKGFYWHPDTVHQAKDVSNFDITDWVREKVPITKTHRHFEKNFL